MKKKTGVSWRNSLFARITVIFIVILIPLYLLGIFIYDSALESVHNEISSSMISQVTFYMDGLEKEVQRLKYLQYDLINDTFLDRLAAIPESMNEIEKVESILILQKRLEAIRSSSIYISDFIVHLPSIERIVTDRYVDPIDMDKYYKLSNLYEPREVVSYIEEMPVLLQESPFMNTKDNTPMYIMEIELDKKAFGDALRQFDKYQGSGAFLISTKNKINISNANISNEVEETIIRNIKSGEQGIFNLKESDSVEKGMCVYVSSEVLGMTLAIYVPENVIYKPIEQYRSWFYVFTFVAAVAIALFSFSIYRFIHKPLIYLVNAFKQMKKGNLQLVIEHHHKDEFRYLYSHFNEMVSKLNDLIKQVYTMKILTQKAELKQLQSQINPHFLYNSFFILHRRIIGGNYENAIMFSQQLGNYFRFIARSGGDLVSLAKEVEHARIYSDIQRMRFTDRISIEFEELPEEFQQFDVPRLILQPIIENAFEHGLENKEYEGILHVGFVKKTNDTLVISVEDNGETLTDIELTNLNDLIHNAEESAEITGIMNINRRLKLKFGAASGVYLSRSNLGGLKAELHICFEMEMKNV